MCKQFPGWGEDSLFIEFGAGRAGLSAFVAQKLKKQETKNV